MAAKGFNVRIPEDVLAAAKTRAAAEHRTLADVIVRFLRAYGAGESAGAPVVAPHVGSDAEPLPEVRQPKARRGRAGRPAEVPAPVPAAAKFREPVADGGCSHSFPDVKYVAGVRVCRKCG